MDCTAVEQLLAVSRISTYFRHAQGSLTSEEEQKGRTAHSEELAPPVRRSSTGLAGLCEEVFKVCGDGLKQLRIAGALGSQGEGWLYALAAKAPCMRQLLQSNTP